MNKLATVALGLGWALGCGSGTERAEPAEPAAVSHESGGSRAARPDGGASAARDGGARAQDGGGADPDAAPRSDGAVTSRPGTTFDQPIKVCGARESYARVARYECPDGSVPLGGDPQAGMRARLGSSRSHLDEPPADPMQSHTVDIYEVPCPSGSVKVYVCMYHCPPGRSSGP